MTARTAAVEARPAGPNGPQTRVASEAHVPRRQRRGADHVTRTSAAANSLDYAALAVIGGVVTVTILGGAVPLRELLFLAFISFVPGRAVTTYWKSLKGSTLAITTLAGSLALTTLLASLTLWLHWWNPKALFAFEALASGTALVLGLAGRRRRRAQRRIAPHPSGR